MNNHSITEKNELKLSEPKIKISAENFGTGLRNG